MQHPMGMFVYLLGSLKKIVISNTLIQLQWEINSDYVETKPS